jgi:hypothetical protein
VAPSRTGIVTTLHQQKPSSGRRPARAFGVQRELFRCAQGWNEMVGQLLDDAQSEIGADIDVPFVRIT